MKTSYGQSSLFGHADYYGNLGTGSTNQQILDWINANQSKLASERFGPNELVSQISAAAQQEQQAAQAAAQRQQEIAMQEDRQRRAEEAQAERLRQMEISARTKAANLSRSGLQSALEIKSSSKSRTAGTQGFRRRKLQVNPTTYSAVASGGAGSQNAAQTKSSGVINV